MVTNPSAVLACALSLFAASSAPAGWPEPRAAAVPGTSGFVVIPGAAVPIEAGRTYKVVFDGTRAAEKPADVLPVLDMAGSELNGMTAYGRPTAGMPMVIVFHGPAVDGLLDDAHYRAKFGMANPNLAVLARMHTLGVRLYVCGQHLAFGHIDPATLSPDVVVAADALIVLMRYQNEGYALLSF